MPITPNHKPAIPNVNVLTEGQVQRRWAAEQAGLILGDFAAQPVSTEDIIDLADYLVNGWIADQDADDEDDSQPVDITEDTIDLEHDFLPAEAAPGASYIGANTLDATP